MQNVVLNSILRYLFILVFLTLYVAVYTVFAFLEYITVATNIFFHGTIILDLEGYALVVGPVEKFKSKS